MRLAEGLKVGLELEFENVSATRSRDSLHLRGLTDVWEAHADYSLRPRDQNTEFVFRHPLADDRIADAVMRLSPLIESDRYQLSWRCGMHIHIDHRNATRGGLIKEITMACLLDRVWYGWDNSGRHESKFCVPLTQVWCDMVKKQHRAGDGRLTAYKYTGVNIARAYPPDIGTVEYRYASSTKSTDRIMEFIGMAQHASLVAQNFRTAFDVVDSFVSAGTYENWLGLYMPKHTQEAWASGLAGVCGPAYPSSLELEAAFGLAQRMNVIDSESALFPPRPIPVRRRREREEVYLDRVVIGEEIDFEEFEEDEEDEYAEDEEIGMVDPDAEAEDAAVGAEELAEMLRDFEQDAYPD